MKIDKKWEPVIVGVGLFIVVYIILSSLTGGGGGAKSSESRRSAPASVIAQVGDATRIGNFAVTIVGSDSKENESGNKEVTLSVSVKNNGSSAEGISSTMFKLRDSVGRTYNSDIVASDITELSLNPGLTKTGVVVFEVPADASGFSALIRGDMFDIGDAEYVIVNLEK